MSLTFDEHDKLNRKPFAERLTTAIEKFHVLEDEAYVVSLNAPFGSGKTTFLKMWESYLKEKAFKTLYINAWEQDFADDPAIPILQALLKITENNGLQQTIKEAGGILLGASALIFSDIIKKFTGVDAVASGKRLEEQQQKWDDVAQGKKLFEHYAYKQKVFEHLREGLAREVQKLAKPLIVLVDELDRTRPDYAVKFLETIKHLFPVKGLCFVLAVDKGQLEASVRNLYGQNMDFPNYYRRFITRQVELPSIDKLDTRNIIAHYYQQYFEKLEDTPHIISNDDKVKLQKWMCACAHILDLKCRQIEHAMRVLLHFYVADTLADTSILYLSTFYLFLRENDYQLYIALGHQQATCDDLKKYFRKQKVTLPSAYSLQMDYIEYTLLLGMGEKFTEGLRQQYRAELRHIHMPYKYKDLFEKIENIESLFQS